jgi:hypothetical protein
MRGDPPVRFLQHRAEQRIFRDIRRDKSIAAVMARRFLPQRRREWQ